MASSADECDSRVEPACSVSTRSQVEPSCSSTPRSRVEPSGGAHARSRTVSIHRTFFLTLTRARSELEEKVTQHALLEGQLMCDQPGEETVEQHALLAGLPIDRRK